MNKKDTALVNLSEINQKTFNFLNIEVNIKVNWNNLRIITNEI
jgi:hypothetical protein